MTPAPSLHRGRAGLVGLGTAVLSAPAGVLAGGTLQALPPALGLVAIRCALAFVPAIAVWILGLQALRREGWPLPRPAAVLAALIAGTTGAVVARVTPVPGLRGLGVAVVPAALAAALAALFFRKVPA